MRKPKFYFGAENQEKLNQAMRLIGEVFPGTPDRSRMPPKDYKRETAPRRYFLEDVMAPRLMGKPPNWSKPHGYRLTEGPVIHSGSFCVYWGYDPAVPAKNPVTGMPTPDEERIIALIHVRKELHPDGRHKVGAPGGHLKHKERSFEGARRETMEEVRDDKDNPIFTPDIERYSRLSGGRDSASKKDHSLEYTGYSYEMSTDEINLLKAHILKFDKDRAYREASIKASKNETHGLRLMPLVEIAGWAQKLENKGQELLEEGDFTHERQLAYYQELTSRLGMGPHPSTPSSRAGYTVKDVSTHVKEGWRRDVQPPGRGGRGK